VAAGTYYVVITVVDGNGESQQSAQSSVTTTGSTSTITVVQPSQPGATTTWSVYVGTTSGGPYYLQSAGNAFTAGVNVVITNTPPTSGTQAPGTDWSQQSAAQVVINNSTITCTTPGANSNTLTFTAGYTPTAADVGNVVNVTGGTNVNTGRYEITGWTSTTWTLNGAGNLTTGTGGGSAILGNMGGALASPAVAAAALSTMGGNNVFVKYSATAYSCSGSQNVANGSVNVTNPSSWSGYDTTRDFYNTDANRPLLNATASTTLFTMGGRGGVRNFSFTNTSSYTQTTALLASAPCHVGRCKATGCPGLNASFRASTDGVILSDCEATGLTSGNAVFNLAAGVIAQGCVSHGNTGLSAIFDCNSGSGVLERCLSNGDSASGAIFSSLNNFLLRGCVSYKSVVTSSGQGAFQIQPGSTTGNVTLEDCVAYGNTGSNGMGFRAPNYYPDNRLLNCAGGGNTGANFNAANWHASGVVGFQTLTADPFTNGAAGDFSLNNAAGGGALLKAAGYAPSWPSLSTASHPDVGLAQAAASGGGGGAILCREFSGGGSRDVSIQPGITYTVALKVYSSTDHVTPLTGGTLAVQLSKAGGAFANPSAGAVNATEMSGGWYSYTLSATDTNTTGDLIIRLTGTGADPAERLIQVRDLGVTVLTEAYAGVGGNATLAQLLYEVAQSLGQFAISGTGISVKKRDGVTQAQGFTLDSATTPTTRSRSS
jgi:hypothetical protein